MLHVTIDNAREIVMLEPDGPLSEEDFKIAAGTIDPAIESMGQLKGLLIHTRSFPGWDSFAALTTHLKFVRNHHAKIARIAFVTDSVIGNLAQSIASHFVNAEIRQFPFAELEQAREWLAGST